MWQQSEVGIGTVLPRPLARGRCIASLISMAMVTSLCTRTLQCGTCLCTALSLLAYQHCMSHPLSECCTYVEHECKLQICFIPIFYKLPRS